jgi:hypothetical protein
MTSEIAAQGLNPKKAFAFCHHISHFSASDMQAKWKRVHGVKFQIWKTSDKLFCTRKDRHQTIPPWMKK